jgi:Glycosyl transferases group 1
MAAADNSLIAPAQLAAIAQPAPVKIAFSYNASWRHVTQQYLADTLAPGCATHFDLDLYRPNVSILRLLEIAQSRGESPDVVAHTVSTPGLPRELQIAPVRTVSLDIDSFWWTESRIRWSMLFDYVFVWHLPLVPRYQAAGHPKVFPMPHAVDTDLCLGAQPEDDRPFDLGWIGAFNYRHYARRNRIVGGLSARFKMNDFQRQHSKQQTADVYRHSKMVVNVSRDDFPPEANMRCYEAMGAGALLITQIPTELTDWGFREGEHFIGWREEKEIPELVQHYLDRPAERNQIARAGQDLTLRDFTFQRCRDKMDALLRENPGEFFAPARKWSPEQVSMTYLDYFYRCNVLDAALSEFVSMRKANPKAYRKGIGMVLKTLRHSVKRALF